MQRKKIGLTTESTGLVGEVENRAYRGALSVSPGGFIHFDA